MKKRNVIIAVLLTFVTIGIYGIYWFIVLTNDTKKMSNAKSAGGGLAFLFSIITFGIYGLYWGYAMGKKINTIKKESNNTIIYFLLNLFLSPLIILILAQVAINSVLPEKSKN